MQHIDAGMDLLRLRYHQHPEWFRSDKISFVDSLLTYLWVSRYNDFKQCGLMPHGAYDFHNGVLPIFCKTEKTWGLDIEDIYSSLHVKGDHWVAIWISIPQRHITIWDCKMSHAKDADIEKCVTPICEVMSRLLHLMCPAEERWKCPETPFTYERIEKGVPQNEKSGDCGVYCLKYIEFHALGMEFPEYLCDKNIKAMRDKLAADILHDLRRNGLEKRTGLEWDLLDMYEGK